MAKKITRTKKTINNIFKNPTSKSERIVIDEVFDNGVARVLRAKRLKGKKAADLSINTWGSEKCELLDTWRVEAFVGFPTQKKLAEGEVFFISNGRGLNNDYKAIPREAARKEHLLIDWDRSRDMARKEIGMEFSMLTAAAVEGDKKKVRGLNKIIAEKFEDNK